VLSIIEKLSPQERNVVRECLRAAVDGAFFPDWEFQTLIGVPREKVRSIADQWPGVDFSDPAVAAGIVGTMNNLLAYPHGRNAEWTAFISCGPQFVEQTLDKLVDLGV